jgi:hypothetical protein
VRSHIQTQMRIYNLTISTLSVELYFINEFNVNFKYMKKILHTRIGLNFVHACIINDMIEYMYKKITQL